jgi:crotonobetainyl-CoA:carnitine CoA-transferase CaiB-like acyl-CoA transferase
MDRDPTAAGAAEVSAAHPARPTRLDAASDAASDALPDAARPLRGTRVLAVEQYGAGPYATLVLADLGAEIIKIEPPGRGDIGRHVPPYAEGNDSLFFQSLNRNKRSVALDLKHPEGRALFHRMVARSDAVFANVRGRSPGTLGLTYEHLRVHNPAIVCTFLTGYGRSGPRADQPAYDYIVQALTGMAAMGGEPGGPPARAGISVVDFSAGLAAAVGLLAALHRARISGEGGDVDASLFSTALSMTNYVASWALTRRYQPERLRHGAHPSIVPSQLFEAQDGWLMVMCQTDAFFRELAERIDAPALAGDARYATMTSRLEHRDALLSELEVRFRERTVAAWLERLEGHVPVAPVNDLWAALNDPQVSAQELVAGYDHPTFGAIRQVAGPVRASAPPPPPRAAPALGADSQELLCTLAGLADDDYRRLAQRGVVG